MAFALTIATVHTKTLIAPSSGVEDKVYGVDYVALDSHDSGLEVADATSGGIPYFSSATAIGTSALLAAGQCVVGGGAGNPPTSTATPSFTSLTLSSLTSGRVAIVGTSGLLEDDAGLTYNKTTDALTVAGSFKGPVGSASATVFNFGFASAGFYSASGLAAVSQGGIGVVRFGLGVSSGGTISSASGCVIGWESGGIGTGNPDAGTSRGGPNSIVHGAGLAGGGNATTRTCINKAVTAFTDAVAKATFTITIPNAAHSASLFVRLTGSLGAGGAIGANESTAEIEYDIAITRTAGVNAVAVASVAGLAATATVAGGSPVQIAAAVSAIAGAVGATNTFTVDVTLTRTAPDVTSTNHTCLCYGELMNANASGVTIA